MEVRLELGFQDQGHSSVHLLKARTNQEKGERGQEPLPLLHEVRDAVPHLNRGGTVSSLRAWMMNQTAGFKLQLYHYQLCEHLVPQLSSL